MGIGTKLSLSSEKFEQNDGDALNLSGLTNIYGNMSLESGSTLIFKSNVGENRMLASDEMGVMSLKSISAGGDLSITGNSEGVVITGNYHYKIVSTVSERDAIPSEERTDGMVVYVIEDSIEYRLYDDEWIMNDIAYNMGTTTGDTIYYVSTGGSDTLGDGSESNPWQTIDMCVKTIPSQLNNKITIQLRNGDYHFSSKTRFILGEFLLNGQLIIKGSMTLIRDDFTTTSTKPDVNNVFKRNVNITFDVEDQYYGYCLDGICPCGKHGVTDLTGTNLYSKNATKIYSYDTRLIFDEERLPRIMNGSQNFRLESLKINFPGSQTIVNFQSFVTHQWWNVVVEEVGNRRIRLNGDFLLNYALIKSSVTSSMCLEIISPNTLAIANLMVYGTGGGKCIELVRSNIDCGSILMDGFDFGFVTQFNCIVGHYTTSPTVLHNINNIFSIFNSGFNLNVNPTTQYYIYNIDYYFNIIVNPVNVNIDLRNIVQNAAVPNIAYFNGTPPAKLVDPSKNFSIQYDGADGLIIDFIELSGTPNTYVDGKWLKVSGSSLVYADAPSGGTGVSTFTGLTDTPNTYVDGKWLKVSGSSLVYTDAPQTNSLLYVDDWDANLNLPELPDASAVTGNYYVVVSGGTYNNTVYRERDWIVSDGVKWDMLRNHTAPFFLTQAEYDALSEAEKADTSKFYLIEDTTGGFTGLTNVGLGSGEIFSNIDNNNVRLRTIMGGDGINVETSGDTVIISTSGITCSFTGLTDTPNTYEDGKWLKVSGSSLVYTDAPSGSPAGNTQTVQYNDNGVFGSVLSVCNYNGTLMYTWDDGGYRGILLADRVPNNNVWNITPKNEDDELSLKFNLYNDFDTTGETVYNIMGLTQSGITLPILPNKTTETKILYVDDNGKVSVGTVSGGSSSWSDIEDKPAWLSATTLNVFQESHNHPLPIENLGIKNSDFSINLSTSKLYTATLTSTGATINVTLTDLLSGESTINVVTFITTNEVTLSWDSSIMWHMGDNLDVIPAGYTYRLNISTQGSNQSDVFIQYSRYLTSI